MADIPRLNGVIRALEAGKPAFTSFCQADPDTAIAMATAKYDGSYRVTANFLNYVTEKYDKDLVKKMNAALREHRYTPELWQQYTGKDVETLNIEWKKTLKPSTRPARRGAATRPAGQ